jgi:O-antigen/teichoic acid export membrane protein
LYAHQRLDCQCYSETFSLLAQLGLLLLFLIRGSGIYSFVYANACTVWLGPAFLFWNCWRLGFLPRANEWGRASWQYFKEVFNFGKDVFLLNFGSQLIMTSQTIVVSRTMGLERAAVWAAGTKLFSLVVSLVGRPTGAALPSMYEMQARGEADQLKRRFRAIVLVTASLGALCGGSFALCNSLFVQVWLNGKIVWSPTNDILLGVWLFILSLQTTHSCFVSVTKKIGGMRYVFFVEGCTFFAVGMLIDGRWGVPGMVTTSIVCSLSFSYQYSVRRTQKFFHCSLRELVWDWVAPSLKLAAAFVVVSVVVSSLDQGLPSIWRLGIHGAVAGIIGGVLFLRVGLPQEMIMEARNRLPRPAARWLQFVSAK